MSKNHYVGVKRIGSADFPRYIVASRDGEYYNGREWVGKRRDAMVFADRKAAHRFCHRLRMVHGGYDLFDVPFHVAVLSGKPLGRRAYEALIKYLSEAVQAEINPACPRPKILEGLQIEVSFLALALRREPSPIGSPPDEADAPADPANAAADSEPHEPPAPPPAAGGDDEPIDFSRD